jgi:hypothetical protein
MEICNGDLLQLFECIELMKNDVKRKMSLRIHLNDVLKSPTANPKQKSLHRSLASPPCIEIRSRGSCIIV